VSVREQTGMKLMVARKWTQKYGEKEGNGYLKTKGNSKEN